jgi:hypothetical protein
MLFFVHISIFYELCSYSYDIRKKMLLWCFWVCFLEVYHEKESIRYFGMYTVHSYLGTSDQRNK